MKISRNKRKANNKGITLIALVITVIILLILAAVSIATLTGENGILTRANDAKTETEEAKEDELRRLTVLEAATNLENQLYKDKNEDTATIPAGFAVSQVEGENTIEDGLVIIDNKGNEFVWVPVEKIEEMSVATIGIDEKGNQNYQGKLYAFTSTGAIEMTNYGQGTDSNREPDTLFDCDSLYLNIIKGILTDQIDKYADINTFKKTMQEDYNKMIKSISIYHGFYVSRYEMSKSSNNTVASVGNVTPLENDSSNMWYGLYAYGKTYNNNFDSVESSMIWGSQYDAMMKWMQSGENGVDITSDIGDDRNASLTTKVSDTDVIKNVYDLYGCHVELTLEAYNSSIRVYRGGHSTFISSPSHRSSSNSYSSGGGGSSRITLYVK